MDPKISIFYSLEPASVTLSGKGEVTDVINLMFLKSED